MNQLETRTALSLAAVFSARMLGLFMILPILPLLAKDLNNSTPFLIGLCIGIYGLTQAILQIPLGMISDKIGRKPVIIGGLLVFALGSILAALSDDIYWIIFARAIQGSGAIAATTMALAADLSREDHRAKMMAFIGMSIGASFAIAMVVGPVISQWGGLSAVFWVTAILAGIGILLVTFVVPTPKLTKTHRDVGILKAYVKPVLTQSTLLRMNLSVFSLHLLMTANFAVLPLIFRDSLQMDTAEHWKIYLPVLFISIAFSLPMIIISEKFRKIKIFFVVAVFLIMLSQVLLAFIDYSLYSLLFAFLLFFIGFNFLEAVQPSLVAKYSDVSAKGTAMGVYSTAQFLGIFVGGVMGGLILQNWGISGVFIFGIVMAVLFLLVAISLPKPDFFKSQLVKLSDEFLIDIEKTTKQLLEISGIKQAAVSAEEGVAYIKIDKLEFDQTRLDSYLKV
ncbi:MAG: MFS family permease [Cocleimonas sp.]|jgi:MFS family permease